MSHNHAYIRRETAISIVINTVLSLLFFLVVFGFGKQVQVWGLGNYVFDFVPQGFMIALMATLVPGAMAGKALRAGRIAPSAERSRLPAALWQRSLVMAVGSALISVALAAVVMALIGADTLPFAAALAGKLVYGAALAAVVTPIGLRAALSASPANAAVPHAQSL
ncbi:hypothetical protein AAFP30_23670 [Gordonia sp. CPCC 205515]|uniref:hypothetical protein n=1 Tax=Gordonia sp. CPCC 205515 TaxID=3140791 RepID=UPI003AF3825B